MAIGFLKLDIGSRGQGQSAVAHFAYETRDKVFSDEDNEFKSYTYKEGLLFKETMLADGANEEWKDGAKLWNAVEKANKSKNARLYRTMIVALPKELSNEQNIELAKDFAKTLVEEGMCVSLAVHDRDKDNDNVHVHITCTTRRVKDGKFLPNESKKYKLKNGNRIPLLDENGNQRIEKKNGRKLWVRESVKNHDWDDIGKDKIWKKRWSEICNNALKANNINQQITFEHDSDHVPQLHEGPKERAKEKRGIKSDKREFNKRVRRANRNINRLKKLRSKIIAQQKFYKDNAHVIAYINDFLEKNSMLLDEKIKKAMQEPAIHLQREVWHEAEQEILRKYNNKDIDNAQSELAVVRKKHADFLLNPHYKLAQKFIEENPNEPWFNGKKEWRKHKSFVDKEETLRNNSSSAEKKLNDLKDAHFKQHEAELKGLIKQKVFNIKAGSLASQKAVIDKSLDFISTIFDNDCKRDNDLAAFQLASEFNKFSKLVSKLIPTPTLLKNFKAAIDAANQQMGKQKQQQSKAPHQHQPAQQMPSIQPQQPAPAPQPQAQAPSASAGRVREIEPPPGSAPKPLKLGEFEGMEKDWALMDAIEREAERMRSATRF